MGTGAFLRKEYLYEATPLHITSTGRYSILPCLAPTIGSTLLTSTAWLANNLAIYVPISVPVPFLAARFMVANGSNTTGNVDIGIYTAAGSRLLSTGSTARASASAVQYIDVTNTVFAAGHYYIGMVASSTTGTFAQATFASAVRSFMTGALEESLGATTLPSTMTPVAFTRTAIPLFGFTQSDTL